MVNSQKLLSKYKNSIKDDYSIVTTSIGGISANTFFDLVIITGLDKNKLAENIFEISLKTINRYKQENKNKSMTTLGQKTKSTSSFCVN